MTRFNYWVSQTPVGNRLSFLVLMLYCLRGGGDSPYAEWVGFFMMQDPYCTFYPCICHHCIKDFYLLRQLRQFPVSVRTVPVMCTLTELKHPYHYTFKEWCQNWYWWCYDTAGPVLIGKLAYLSILNTCVLSQQYKVGELFHICFCLNNRNKAFPAPS